MPNLLIWLAIAAVAAMPAAQPRADELFESSEPLAFTLEGPFRKIRKDRDRSQSYPGKLVHEDRTYNVTLSVRGNNRLNKDICRHPPLWVDFDKEERRDSLFDKQKHVKLVVLCRDNNTHIDYLRAEYLVYRMMNQLTDLSFRVRWVEVTHIDEKKKVRVAPAFFIERKGRLDNRVNHKKSDRLKVKPSELAPNETALASLFQYVVANTDFSFTVGADKEDDCCHNAKLLSNDEGYYVPISYDFDASGIIRTSYAVPNKTLGIQSVTQRLYRGFCRHKAETRSARSQILANEPQLISLLESDPVLRERKAKNMVKYLRESLDILRDEDRFEKYVIKQCWGD